MMAILSSVIEKKKISPDIVGFFINKDQQDDNTTISFEQEYKNALLLFRSSDNQ